ncbi:ATP synthase gamma chain [Luteitalea sp. TBR-22]|uniref:ATP synthase F1 subunit gamma n=1 Tax=Luteitalea sp. TBR-22 TaxID=2802971 RepID=UPI001AF410DE|nr:ATP synthase F1 subunit gamma [Luteitalea sp. TBR-22]BCS36112.1 ATP synthase gamma chain [Luteitalea sp. TBR-22]
MPSLIDIRRRVRAVKSTQQITKAMKMVSASKLRRAQDRVIGARPYANQALRVMSSVARRVDPEAHPLLRESGQPGAPPLLIVISADRGLCGSFNSNVVKQASTFVQDSPDRQVAMGLIGRKARDFFKRRRMDVRYEAVNVFQQVKYSHAQDLAAMAIEQFTTGQVSSVYLVYNEFKSVMNQRVVVERLLPIPRLTPENGGVEGPLVDYLYEPSADEILSTIVPRHVEIQMYRALLESAAAEHAARMTAMDAATRNAQEMVDKLSLYMNKVRQAAITREIIEVVSGAQAL